MPRQSTSPKHLAPKYFLFFFSLCTILAFSGRHAPPSSLRFEANPRYNRGNLGFAGVNKTDSRTAVCLMFDRPPRTGSTTALYTLYSCWGKTQRFQVVSKFSKAGVAKTFLKSPLKHVASVGYHHHWFNETETDEIIRGCGELFYVTSTRAEAGRIFSRVKQRISSAAGFDTRTNSTLNSEASLMAWNMFQSQLKSAMAGAKSDLAGEFWFYPFSSQRIIWPDYVVRYEHYSDDMSKLLQAFSCPEKIQTQNVHGMLAGPQEGDTNNDENVERGFGFSDLKRRSKKYKKYLTDEDVNTTTQMKSLNEDEFTGVIPDRRHEVLSDHARRNNQLGLRKAIYLTKLHQEYLRKQE